MTTIGPDEGKQPINSGYDIRSKVDHVQRQTVPPQILPGEVQFPAQYFSKKKDEEKVSLIQNYVKQLGKNVFKGADGVSVNYVPTETDYNIIKRRDAENTHMAFDTFVSHYLKPSQNPAIAQYLKQIYPEFIDARVREIKTKLALQEKLAMIRINGTPDKDDLIFLFSIINMEPKERVRFMKWLKTAVFEPGNKEDVYQSTYNRGPLNVKRIMGNPVLLSQDNMFTFNGGVNAYSNVQPMGGDITGISTNSGNDVNALTSILNDIFK